MARQEVLVRNAEILAIHVQENKKEPEKPYLTAFVFTEAGEKPKFFEVSIKSRDEVKLLDPHVRKKGVSLVLDCFSWAKQGQQAQERYTFLGLLSEFMKAG